MAKISAQDTVQGHASSNKYFISSITSNPLSEFRFGPACFSLIIPPKSSSNNDASHPYRPQGKSKLITKHTNVYYVAVLQFNDLCNACSIMLCVAPPLNLAA